QRTIGIKALESLHVTRVAQCLDAGQHSALAHRAPEHPSDGPWLAQVAAGGRHPSQLSGIHSNSMSLNVVRMTVGADLVISDQHLWTPVADHWYQLIRSFQQVRCPKDSFPKHVAS